MKTSLRRGGIVLSFLGCCWIPVLGQSADSSRTLPVVVVRGSTPERFLAGQKIQVIDSVTLAQTRFQTLTDLLSFTTPIAFKVYGPGQLATVSFRGTSANHTAVLWNGININQPTLGQTDFSTIPVAGFNQLSVQYGSAASCVGSDAVGGSILLSAAPDWKNRGLSALVGQQLASFGNHPTQAGLYYVSPNPSGRRWQLATKTFYYASPYNNRFPYTERGGYFVEQSTTHQRGFLQDLYLRRAPQQQLSLNIWLSDNNLLVTPNDPIAREQTRSQAYRFLTAYETKALTVRLGWIRDIIDYARGNLNAPSHSETDRFISRAEREFAIQRTRWQTSVRLGGEWVHYRTRVDGYRAPLIQENRADLYALLRMQSDRWTLSANLRQAFVTRFDPPLTPSIGAEYRMLPTGSTSQLTAKFSSSRSYRVPTLNERYWAVLGNPSLRPENGFNLEGGLAGQWTLSKKLTLTSELTAYRNRVDNWSYWNPDYGYRVENLQLVVARGIEWTANGQYSSAPWQTGLRMGYALNRSSQERAYNVYAQDIIGKQLTYVPLHSGNLSAYLAHGKHRVTIQTQASSRRYITFDNSQFLRGFVLTNLLLETQYRRGPVHLRIQGQINNLFNTVYLNVKRNAMPGRSASINLICNLNTKQP